MAQLPVHTSVERAKEEELVYRCQAGDWQAFEDIVGLYQGKVYRLALQMVGEEQAEDIVQEVFVRVYRSIPRFQQQSSLGTWIYRIATNLCRDQLRYRRRRPQVAFSLDQETTEGMNPQMQERAPGPGEEMEKKETRQVLLTAIGRLSAKHREVFVLHDLHALTYEEIGQVAGCSVGTVKSRLFYARRELRKALERVGLHGGGFR